MQGETVRLRRKLVSNMKKLRAEKKITQEQLAEAIGITRQTISYLEKGEYNPSLKIAHDIAKFFDKAIDEVFQYESILKIKREQFNLSQDQLATLIGVNVKEIIKLENEDFDDSATELHAR